MRGRISVKTHSKFLLRQPRSYYKTTNFSGKHSVGSPLTSVLSLQDHALSVKLFYENSYFLQKVWTIQDVLQKIWSLKF